MSLIAGMIERFRHSKSENARHLDLSAMENEYTPLEFSKLLAETESLSSKFNAKLKQLYITRQLGREPPQRYVRDTLHPAIKLYHDPEVPVAEKRLIVGFCSSSHRLMMPLSMFLQSLPSRYFDVLVLSDLSRSHYLNGIESYSDSFLGVVQSLARDVRIDRYCKIYCYGTSMGGFPALRCGVLLNADRAISVGGRFPWHVNRLLSGRSKQIPAFDLLCPCVAAPKVKLICVYGIENEQDRTAAALLSARMHVQHVRFSAIGNHNVIFRMLESGQLNDFYHTIFEMPRHDSGIKLKQPC